MQLSKQPVLVAGGSLLERLDISPGAHVTSLSHPRLLFGSTAGFEPLPALGVDSHRCQFSGAADSAPIARARGSRVASDTRDPAVAKYRKELT
jgi:hypothetical protein